MLALRAPADWTANGDGPANFYWTLGMARIRWILIIIGVSVLLVFSLANTNSVPIRMPLVFEKKVPLAMLLAGSALIGFMIGALWTAWMLRPPGNNRPGNNRPGHSDSTGSDDTNSAQKTT